MRGLITCAGMGTRLNLLTEKNNKALLKIGGTKSMLDIILDTFKKYGIMNSVVITGHCADKVEKALPKKGVCAVFNPFYQVSGILCSIWFAKPFLEGTDFVFVTGDSIFYPGILENCMKTKGDIVVCIENKKCDAEDSKVIVRSGSIAAIGKDLSIDKATGEFTGMLRVSARASKIFFSEVETLLRQSKLNAYVADVLVKLKKKGIRLTPFYTNGSPRIEIDYPEDLEKGRSIYRNYIRPVL